MLCVQNLYLEKDDKSILQDIYFTVKKGECIGLAGTSGSGKSSLLRCIQGLEEYHKGSIRADGTIGFLFQDFQLFPHFTVLKNIFYPASLHKELGVTLQDAYSVLQELAIEHLAERFPYELSGGQKQRVALARALMMKPQLLLCDEPTSGLDMRSTERVSSMLRTAAKQGLAMIIASHEIPFLLSLCDRIIMLGKGKLLHDLEAHNCSTELLYASYQ